MIILAASMSAVGTCVLAMSAGADLPAAMLVGAGTLGTCVVALDGLVERK